MNTEEHIERMFELWPSIPSPEHHPLVFQYYIKLYKQIVSVEEDETCTQQILKNDPTN